MKSFSLKISILLLIGIFSSNINAQEFQGKAFYFSKSTMDLGRWGARLSEAQKKQVMARMKNRLEKTYVLSFNKTESFFKEDEKLDAMSGATDSWGKNFAQGDSYKNVKENQLVQSQEFYGKKFLVKDKLQKIDWQLGKETKQIGNYTCFKAMALIPSDELSWYNFSWDKLRRQEPATDSTGTIKEPEIKMTQVEAWYTPQIPVSHGPSEYWGLPGLILEVSADNNTMLCSKIVINPKETIEIEAPKRGEEITKKDYQSTVVDKMQDFRNNRGRRRRG
ncbi:MAG: GLPGLI family protein [Winogradskyella sp.]|uniref:GLPGLI family protein n=1 Tax=Winogradskyella sp. TaxID=1883156 RepID=UPI0017980EEC|nr:GLPGLI family protein [Winogradskyella sp.]MBT8243621.1 GLPGLI family protein [Winogradskyella sp.]NNK23855.1 GLPGLI family protein [Winogradskyella sp.]